MSRSVFPFSSPLSIPTARGPVEAQPYADIEGDFVGYSMKYSGWEAVVRSFAAMYFCEVHLEAPLVNGRMSRPHLAKAKALLTRLQAAGLPMEGVFRWGEQGLMLSGKGVPPPTSMLATFAACVDVQDMLVDWDL